jgi:dCMP deaminase
MRKPSSWSETWMSMVRGIAKRSKDPSTQVGAVLVSPDNRKVHTGYNGFPIGIKDTKARWKRPTKYSFVLHSEVNSILNSKTDLTGWTLYVSIPPCSSCALIIIQAGIKKVVYENLPSKESQLDYKFAVSLLKEAKVELVKF